MPDRSALKNRARRVVAVSTALAVTGLGAFALSAAGGHVAMHLLAARHQPAPARQPAPAAPAAVASPQLAVAAGQPGVTTVASLLRAAPRYARPGVREAGTVPAQWWQRPSVLPVIATRPGWVQVRLAQRPDGSTAWLPDSDVALATTPYRIVINLATTHLSLFKDGQRVMSVPAGVGAPGDPTPSGHYFVAFSEPPPGPGYGPFVLVTSVHSKNITDWDGSGDGVIGIHGPLGEDALIGTTGARISHGCIRLHLSALDKLAAVPAGTPIDVIG